MHVVAQYILRDLNLLMVFFSILWLGITKEDSHTQSVLMIL